MDTGAEAAAPLAILAGKPPKASRKRKQGPAVELSAAEADALTKLRKRFHKDSSACHAAFEVASGVAAGGKISPEDFRTLWAPQLTRGEGALKHITKLLGTVPETRLPVAQRDKLIASCAERLAVLTGVHLNLGHFCLDKLSGGREPLLSREG